jgi:UDP-2-acetamido-2-deoxy-ribo-hexuluronate aminotransferase
MQFIDLAAQQERIRDQLEENLHRVLNHGKYIMGPEVGQLETLLGNYVGNLHAISCSSGTDALMMALMANGVGPGDAVFTTPFTFISTAEVIVLLGATPVFIDIDPTTYNMDPAQLKLGIEALQKRNSNIYPLPEVALRETLCPKGLIAVDLFGLPADYAQIGPIAEASGLFVVEDAAQSFGSQSNGKRAGSFGQVACTSFFPAKPFGCYGDGGMCFTDSEEISAVLKSIRVHGKGIHKYDNARIGINGRLDTFQAAVLLAKFSIFPDEIEKRNAVAEIYNRILASAELELPTIPVDCVSSWAQYSIQTESPEKRKKAMAHLKEKNVPTTVYYPKPLHLQPAFQSLRYNSGAFPVSETISNKIFSLPMHPYLKPEDQELICRELIFAVSQ